MDTVLKLENLSVHFDTPEGTVQAVREVSLELRKGETLAIVGESGCGKSTLARMAVRLLPPSSGDILFAGRSLVDRKNRHVDFSRHLQMVFQDPFSSLNPRLRVGTSVAEPLPAGTPGAERREIVRDMLVRVGLRPEHASRYPHEFSGGQRQRLGLARALLHNSPVYLFDEATSNIDAESEDDIMSAIRAMRGKRTVILISHRLANVMDCDTIYTFAAGHVVEQGSHAQLLAAGGEYSRLYNAQKQLEDLGEVSA